MKTLKTFLVLLIFVSLCADVMALSVCGGLFPSTSPMRVKGLVTIGGVPTANMNITAKVVGLMQMSVLTNGSGYYDINSLCGKSTDSVVVYVEGMNDPAVPNMNYPFAEFSILTKDFDFPLQPNGTMNCTNASVCAGGYCVGTPGICSGNPFYCDNDGSCEGVYGEDTSTCPADCPVPPSGGGGGGGGGGGSTPEPEVPVEPAGVWCGDGSCAAVENCGNCAKDCGACEVTESAQEPASDVSVPEPVVQPEPTPAAQPPASEPAADGTGVGAASAFMQRLTSPIGISLIALIVLLVLGLGFFFIWKRNKGKEKAPKKKE